MVPQSCVSTGWCCWWGSGLWILTQELLLLLSPVRLAAPTLVLLFWSRTASDTADISAGVLNHPLIPVSSWTLRFSMLSSSP